MPTPPESEALRWWLQASRDLDTAGYLADGGRYEVACFLAQQAAEKALKAYLYFRGEEQVVGHSVAVLCQRAGAYEPAFASLQAEAAPLDRNYIPTRYPNGLPGGVPYQAFQKPAADEALDQAGKVLATVGRLIGFEPG